MEMFKQWNETKAALLEGLSKSKREIVSKVLENSKQVMLNETAAAGATQAHDVAGFRKILLPMIRRVIPGTIATEIVGVQPMEGPVSLVYSMRYKYVEAMTHDPAASPFGGHDIAPGNEAFGNLSPIRAFYAGGTGAAQPAGASGIGPSSPGDIAAATADGQAWPSSIDAAATGALGAFGPLHGGSGSYLEGSGGRKMALEVVSQAVESKTRKLQSGWTIEAMQDLNAQHGLDIESEMVQVMSAEIVQEIDAEILTDLLALAGTVATWDYSTYVGPNYQPAYIGDRFANLGALINYMANEIGRKTRRGTGNFIVVSPMIVSVLQTAAKSVFAPAIEGSFKGPNNTQLVGTLNGNIKVYSYLWNQSAPLTISGGGASVVPGNDTILVGYKGGNGELDSGYFYAPYIPLMSSGVVMNPVTFQPVVSLMTRYGKTFFTQTESSLGNSSDYYGKINVVNLDFV